MKQIDISVNICTYNRLHMFRNALSSLLKQETNGLFSHEIIIIDDGSTDGTSSFINEMSINTDANIKYFREERVGIARARNRGFIESRGEWIAFIDDDECADKRWLLELYREAIKTGGDCIGGKVKIIQVENTSFNLAGINRKLHGETINVGFFKRKLTYNGPGTGNALVKRTVFDKIGLFDPLLKIVRGTDQDFFRRARKSGFKIVFTPNAIIHHIIPFSRTLPEYLIKSAKQNGENLAYFDCKYLGHTKTLFLCFFRINHAIFITMPKLTLAYLKNKNNYILSGKCSLYFVYAYVHWTLFRK